MGHAGMYKLCFFILYIGENLVQIVGMDAVCVVPVSYTHLDVYKRQPFTLRLADGRFERACAVIVAAGGTVARELLPKGTSFSEPELTLGPLSTDPRWPRRLDNIRVRGALELWRPDSRGMDGRALSDGGYPMGTHEGERLLSREGGEVMFRKYGVSGIAAFNLSRLAEPCLLYTSRCV